MHTCVFSKEYLYAVFRRGGKRLLVENGYLCDCGKNEVRDAF